MMICEKDGRLPMGAPTSPTLSNFAMHLMDLELEIVAKTHGWTYSRYADDLTFSGKTEFSITQIDLLRDYIRAFRFEPNERKTRIFSPKMTKEVTGILLLENQKLDLPAAFFEELDDVIAQLATVIAVEARHGDGRSFWTQDFENQIRGMIEFSEYVLGERHEKVVLRENNFKKALKMPDFRAMSWLDFHYVGAV